MRGNIIGYECLGCGETFLFADFDDSTAALEAAKDHAANGHNTGTAVGTAREAT